MTAGGGGSGGNRGPGPVPVADGGDPAIETYGLAPGDALHGDAADLEARVDDLLERARAANEAFVPPAEAPSRPDPDERALAYCRRGLWPVIAAYLDRRSAGARLGQPHHDRLAEALDTWLALYARCYGVEIDPDCSVRQAAEVFVATHNVRDVAQLLTDVPPRSDAGTGDAT